MNNKTKGKIGEDIAVYYLKKNGYKILKRNYKKEISSLKKGEIDIICIKKGIIHFVEVKTILIKKDNGYFLPELKVNFQKKTKIKKLAQLWLTENNFLLNKKWQIDILAIKINKETKKAKIKFFENILTP